MSIYFDTTKQFYVVRSYIQGTYAYIGRYKTPEEAEEADNEWKEDPRLKRQNNISHTKEWFEQTSKKQRVELYKKYPPYSTRRAEDV